MKSKISSTITKTIRILPFSKLTNMKIERQYRIFKDKLKKCPSSYYPLVLTNISYGDEFLLKRYSGFPDYIYAVIEHGLYLGKNSAKIEDERDDYDLKSIITLSDYRMETIKEAFPGYHCLAVGPMIHYAQTDNEFQEHIEKQKRPGKTLLYFPVHGTTYIYPHYDKLNAFRKIVSIAENHNCENIIVCVYRGYTGLMEELQPYNTYGKELKVIITDCGLKTDAKFLDRQKTLIQISDYAVSNSVGTNLGYCIYSNKPYYLLPDNVNYLGTEKERSSNWESDYEREKKLFHLMFSNTSIEQVTTEQRELCSHYWGYNHVKTPDDLRSALEEINKKSRTIL